MVTYPVLIGEIAKRGIKKKTIADSIGVCSKSLTNRLLGKVPFTWPEVQIIQQRFFPDVEVKDLFSTSNKAKNRTIFFFLLLRVCDKALPAAVLLALLVRPSRNTFDAADAALGLVCLLFIRSPPFYGIILYLWEENVNTVYGVKYRCLKR